MAELVGVRIEFPTAADRKRGEAAAEEAGIAVVAPSDTTLRVAEPDVAALAGVLGFALVPCRFVNLYRHRLDLGAGRVFEFQLSEDGHGTVLRRLVTADEDVNTPLGAVLGTLEDVILGHAQAGLDVEDAAYVRGLSQALESAVERYGD